jgi:hypothetical protein
MNSDSLFYMCEIAAALFLGALDIVVGAMFIYAYVRCRRIFLLLLCAGSLVFGLSTLYTALVSYMALIHVNVLSPTVLHLLAWGYLLVMPGAGVVSFIGTVLLLRFILSLLQPRRDLTNR